MHGLRLTVVTWLVLSVQMVVAQQNLLPDGAFENGFEPWHCGQEKSAKLCVESGYPVIHFDQKVSGSASSSYCGHRGHGHAPGYGPWIHEALAKMHQRLRDTCAPLHPDFTLSIEEWGNQRKGAKTQRRKEKTGWK